MINDYFVTLNAFISKIIQATRERKNFTCLLSIRMASICSSIKQQTDPSLC